MSKVSKKVSTKVWLLSKIQRYLSVKHRVLFYKSCIQPHLDYANIVWGSVAKTNLMQIERLQRRACRAFLNDKYKSMNDIRMMSFSERVFLRKAKFMFKVANNVTPEYINHLSTKRQQKNNDGNETLMLPQTAADNFILPKPRTELYKSSTAFFWSINAAQTSESFHSRCAVD